MKHFSKPPLLMLIIAMLLSCSHNRLKTNEKELAKEILIQEKEKEVTYKAVDDKQTADTINRPARAFRFKEDRSVDSGHPPLEIDIAGSLNNVKDINLSDVATGITYIRMEPIPDSTLKKDLKFKYYLMDNYIVAVNLYGIHLFTKDGRYLRTVVKNKFTGVEVHPGEIRIWDNYTMKGGGTSVWASGNNLFYNYNNNITGQKYIMEYDCSSSLLTPDYKFDPEKPDQISGLGTIAIDLNHGKTEPPKPIEHPGLSGGSPEGFFLRKSVFKLDQNSYALPTHRDDIMMIILNNQGDTLSTFTKFEKLKNYTNPLQRSTDYGTQYEHKGKLYFRSEFNDTVFEVIPPNRLLPVYILKLGTYKASLKEGVDPDFNLSGKIIPGQWAESNDFIFMTFTKDGYDCQINRGKKSVKIYYAIYSKLNHQLSVINGDPFDYSPEILKNNFDGGMPVWPLSYMIGNNGEMLISLKGKQLKDRVKTEQFKVSKAPEVKKKELENLAVVISESEDILMIVR